MAGATNSTANQRIVRNTLFLYIRMGLVLIVSLFTTRIVLQSLGVEDYGIYNAISGFVSMFAFLNTSMSNGIQRFYNFSLGRETYYSVKDVYNSAIRIQVLLAVVLVLLLESIGVWYMHTKMVIPIERFKTAMIVFQLSLISLLIIVLQIPYSAAIMAYEKMDYYAYVSIFDVMAKLGVAYAIKSSSEDRLLLYGLLSMLVSVLGFFFYYIYAKTRFKDLVFVFRVKKQLFRPMLSFSGWNVFGSFAYMLKNQGVNLLLNFFFGPIVNAARGVSSMVMSAVHGFQTNVVVAFRPQVVQSYAGGNYARVKQLFYSLSKISFVLMSILSIPIIFEVDSILHLWLGDTIPDYSSIFTILVLVNMVISSLNTPISQVVHATGKMRNYQVGTSLAICLIIPVSWIFLKLGYDAPTVYWISLFITIINQIVCLVLLKRVFNYSYKEYLLRVIMPCCVFLILAIITPFLITRFVGQSYVRLFVNSLVSLITSIAIAYVVMLEPSEKILVKTFLKRIITK